MTAEKPSIAVLGAGSYGTSLAMVLARNNLNVTLWARNSKSIEEMAETRENRLYVPGIKLPNNIRVSANLKECVETHRDLLVVVPSHAFRPLIQTIKPFLSEEARLAWASKGLDPVSGMLLDSVVAEELEHALPCAVLSGPTFAKELALNLPTATTLAANDDPWLQDLTAYFHNENFRVYSSHDMTGVQLCGAVKNVIAVGAGLADGLGFGANARTALITRGIAELTRLGMACGGAQATFSGMAGLGDLVLTCTDDQSRNRRFGLALGRGESQEDAQKTIGQVVEAVRNTKEVYQLACKQNVEVPIIEQIYQVLYENKSPFEAAKQLMTRELKSESE